ncbi:DUF1003 domain-containing protein [Nostocoides vanveenii]|uniref:DUF1003 domain-containing protein n=1 Tax=Nostocoides vanveenii TaxID=330835 RepID=A0ABP4X9L5_9MICO
MAERRIRLDQPQEQGRRWSAPSFANEEFFGAFAEKFARFMGTSYFLIGMSIFVVVWVGWNLAFTTKPWQFDKYPFIFLTLMLSLQASYAAPLILLAQNRQADRDRVALEQDRARDERNLADTEFLTREVAALRIALRDSATRDFVRSELRMLLEELEGREDSVKKRAERKAKRKERAKAKAKAKARAERLRAQTAALQSDAARGAGPHGQAPGAP